VQRRSRQGDGSEARRGGSYYASPVGGCFLVSGHCFRVVSDCSSLVYQWFPVVYVSLFPAMFLAVWKQSKKAHFAGFLIVGNNLEQCGFIGFPELSTGVSKVVAA
jgi:hypothetical protein